MYSFCWALPLVIILNYPKKEKEKEGKEIERMRETEKMKGIKKKNQTVDKEK